jgi:ADP-ribose pyrophosphatase YjhB (NUDIX family)
LEAFRTKLFRAARARWALTRSAMTLGVRVIVVEDGRVLLVRHGYEAGWHLPGGGVDRGETAADAAAREIMEEAGVKVLETPRLIGLCFNEPFGGRDHVAVYVVTRLRRGPEPRTGYEIAERGWFPIDALPQGATPGTLRRLAEFREGRPVSDRW